MSMTAQHALTSAPMSERIVTVRVSFRVIDCTAPTTTG
jgi:hypothetical protein